MPVYAADLLPDTTGRNLGNPSQRWNANLQSLNVLGSTSLQPVSGQTIIPGGAIYVATAPITGALNSTNPQNLSGCVIPAGLLNAPGKVLRATMGGTYTTQSGQTPFLVIVANLGSVNVFAISTGALSAGQANNTWRAQWEFTVYVPGSSAQIDPHGTMVYQPANGSNIGSLLIHVMSATVGPADLTIPQMLQCQCSFSTNTSPANVCVQREFILEVLN